MLKKFINTPALFILPWVLLSVFTLLKVRVLGEENIASLSVLKVLLSQGRGGITEGIYSLDQNGSIQDACWKNWLAGLLYDQQGKYEERDDKWTLIMTLKCPYVYINFLESRVPDNPLYAQLALNYYPQVAESWFWSAEIYGGQVPHFKTPEEIVDYPRAIEYYRHGLLMEPKDGRRWLYLGHLLVITKQDLGLAIDAYLNACFNGDPGSNGCYRAGFYTEKLGDIRTAIKYYRLSKWKTALEQADKLERSLLNQP